MMIRMLKMMWHARTADSWCIWTLHGERGRFTGKFSAETNARMFIEINEYIDNQEGGLKAIGEAQKILSMPRP